MTTEHSWVFGRRDATTGEIVGGLVPDEAVTYKSVGNGDWLEAAGALETARRISPSDADALRWQWLFGRLIGNTDMHFGNVSFTWDPANALRLSPAYDMLPMRWAPVREELSSATLEPFVARPEWARLFSSARDAARSFWSLAAARRELHASMRTVARRNAAA